MISTWRTGVALERGDEAAGGLPAARRTVRLQQVGGTGAEPNLPVVADVGVDVGVEHPSAGDGLQEALAGEVPSGGLQHLVDGLVHAPVEDPDVVGVVADVAPVGRLVVRVE